MPIEIVLSPDYKLTSDERNIIVNERYFTDPTKAPNWPKRLAENPDLDPSPIARWREIAYFSSVDRAIMFVMDRRVKLSDANTLEDLARIIREFRGKLAALLTVEGNCKG
ncbi:hypothetical protein P9E81_08610 [Bacillus licheniformis]|uniref:hypothetical protein n=1 Tax=Bacillus licheniformis TaxID=1402 RepID=UPI002DBAF0E9|nr:hypothetical protein [Bacillus licheniformis]MEC1851476.1 hypothetical protein [Bacillus licheniformis]